MLILLIQFIEDCDFLVSSRTISGLDKPLPRHVQTSGTHLQPRRDEHLAQSRRRATTSIPLGESRTRSEDRIHLNPMPLLHLMKASQMEISAVGRNHVS